MERALVYFLAAAYACGTWALRDNEHTTVAHTRHAHARTHHAHTHGVGDGHGGLAEVGILFGSACQSKCEAAGHCSSGLTSCRQLPSCSMGCAVASLGVTLDACMNECVSLGKPGCTADFQNLTFSKCAACPHWAPGQQPPSGDPNPNDCGVPAVAHCEEGCKYAHGAPPVPFSPPCVPGSFCCPGEDPAFNKSSVLFAGNFGENMVLQREPAHAAVFGTATPGAHVTVMIQNEKLGYKWQSTPTQARSDGDNETVGTWKVILPARPAGTNYTVVASCADCSDSMSTAELHEVAFGEVWLCSGQSNMEAMVEVTFARNESFDDVNAGKYSNVRLWQTPWRPMKNATYILPPLEVGGRPTSINWETPTNETLPPFSAVCWYFGKSLADDKSLAGVPIGLIGTFVGGTFIEQWIRPEKQADCTETLCGSDDLESFKCGTLYNGHIAPFINQTIAGIIWYQGENNVRNVAGSIKNRTGYACQMASLIRDWRSVWSAVPNTTRPEFPFGVTQLAGSCSEGFPQNTGAFRRSQTGGYGLLPNPDMPNTFLGQAFDLGDPWQHGCMKTGACFGWNVPYSLNKTRNYENSAIHPRPKQPLGERLARAYFAVANQQSPLLPVLSKCTSSQTPSNDYSNGAIRLSFAGLGSHELDEPIYNPEWPGASGIELEIDGNWIFVDTIGLNLSRSTATTIDVMLPRTGAVSGIRYAWADNPCCGSNNRTYDPCPPMACPLLTKGSLPEPVVPFLATVHISGGDISCSCDAPMVC